MTVAVAEQASVLEVINSTGYCDLSIGQVWARELDQGRYWCSMSSMYRIARVARQIRESNIAQSQHVRWFDSGEDVRAIYSTAYISTSSSLYENNGAAVAAAAMSLPSIVSDAGGLPETVEAASGWIVQAGSHDALQGVLEAAIERHHNGALDAMGADARAHVEEQFALDICARRHVDLFQVVA